MNANTVPPPLPASEPRANQNAVYALVLSLIPWAGRMLTSQARASWERTPSMVWVMICTFVGFLAVVAGAVALVQIRASKATGKGFAIAGICLGTLEVLLSGFASLHYLIR